MVLRDAETLAVIFMQDCDSKIDKIEWSRDSDHVLCAMYRKAKCSVSGASDDAWRSRWTRAPPGPR